MNKKLLCAVTLAAATIFGGGIILAGNSLAAENYTSKGIFRYDSNNNVNDGYEVVLNGDQITANKNAIESVKSDIDSLNTDVSDGKDAIVQKLKNLGVTPSDNNFSTLVSGIDTLATNKYNDGNTAGITAWKPTSASITNAGALTVKNSSGTAVYTTTLSNSYDAGYEAGVATGKQQVPETVYWHIESTSRDSHDGYYVYNIKLYINNTVVGNFTGCTYGTVPSGGSGKASSTVKDCNWLITRSIADSHDGYKYGNYQFYINGNLVDSWSAGTNNKSGSFVL